MSFNAAHLELVTAVDDLPPEALHLIEALSNVFSQPMSGVEGGACS